MKKLYVLVDIDTDETLATFDTLDAAQKAVKEGEYDNSYTSCQFLQDGLEVMNPDSRLKPL